MHLNPEGMFTILKCMYPKILRGLEHSFPFQWTVKLHRVMGKGVEKSNPKRYSFAGVVLTHDLCG